MCTLFDEITKEGKAEGIIETGLDFGLSEYDILERLQKKLDISLQKAQEYFEMFGKQTVWQQIMLSSPQNGGFSYALLHNLQSEIPDR